MRFQLVWYRFSPNLWIGVLVSCPAQAEDREVYPRTLRPKLRSAVTFSQKTQKNAISAKPSVFSQKLRLWMTLRGGILRDTLVSMPQSLKIKKICIQNSKWAKNQDSGLMVRISRQATRTSDFFFFLLRSLQWLGNLIIQAKNIPSHSALYQAVREDSLKSVGFKVQSILLNFDSKSLWPHGVMDSTLDS